ncbi:MAG: DUF364 domain-containing protein [Alphaproteobacteria bacterium]
MTGDLRELLARAVGDRPARRVVVGVNWVLVEGPDGTGLAHAPPRDAPGCRPLASAGTLAGSGLGALAALWSSANPFEASIGLAAINAHFNRPDLAGEAVNGLDAAARIGRRPVVFGRFPGLDRIMPTARVVERHPGPDDHPLSDAPALVAESDLVIATASALGNGTLGDILAIARGTPVMLVGPSTPLAPVLFDHGIIQLAGMVIDDPARAAQVVMEGGAVHALLGAGRNLTLAAAS